MFRLLPHVEPWGRCKRYYHRRDSIDEEHTNPASKENCTPRAVCINLCFRLAGVRPESGKEMPQNRCRSHDEQRKDDVSSWPRYCWGVGNKGSHGSRIVVRDIVCGKECVESVGLHAYEYG